MKSMILSLIIAMSVQAQAGVKSSVESIRPSDVGEVIKLVNSSNADGSLVMASVVVADKGLSTDVSPRHDVYFTYARLSEMSNLKGDFRISNKVWEFKSVRKTEKDIYQIRLVEVKEGRLENVIYTINIASLKKQVADMLKKCGSDFCDGNIKAELDVVRDFPVSDR